MFYTRLKVTCDAEVSEIIMAEVGELGFDSFLETDSGFEAYVELENYDKPEYLVIQEKYQQVAQFQQDQIQKQNWNEDWEKGYHPIVVEETCLIRAEFHQIEKEYPYELIITPKMSFGTGHHQTTYLMVKNQLLIEHRNKRVMDAGCGTAILSILASKLGADEVEAFDIDEWSVSNGIENIEVNRCTNIHHKQGRLSELNISGKFDIILANINKNILLEELKLYQEYLASDGLILLSGFYTEDIADLLKEAGRFNLKERRRDERDNWAALLLNR